MRIIHFESKCRVMVLIFRVLNTLFFLVSSSTPQFFASNFCFTTLFFVCSFFLYLKFSFAFSVLELEAMHTPLTQRKKISTRHALIIKKWRSHRSEKWGCALFDAPKCTKIFSGAILSPRHAEVGRSVSSGGAGSKSLFFVCMRVTTSLSLLLHLQIQDLTGLYSFLAFFILRFSRMKRPAFANFRDGKTRGDSEEKVQSSIRAFISVHFWGYVKVSVHSR